MDKITLDEQIRTAGGEMSKPVPLTVADLRQRLFQQLDRCNQQEFTVQTAQVIASLASAINKSWEMQIALENLKRTVKQPKEPK